MGGLLAWLPKPTRLGSMQEHLKCPDGLLTSNSAFCWRSDVPLHASSPSSTRSPRGYNAPTGRPYDRLLPTTTLSRRWWIGSSDMAAPGSPLISSVLHCTARTWQLAPL